VSRFTAGEPDQQADVPARVETIVRAIVQLGGTYPDVVQFLQQASSHHALSSRLAFDAVAEVDPWFTVHEEAAARSREIPTAPAEGDEAAAIPPRDESS
jgi:hypothetical protein